VKVQMFKKLYGVLVWVIVLSFLAQAKVSIGIVQIVSRGDDTSLQMQAEQYIRKKLEEMGFYTVMGVSQLGSEIKKLGKEVPDYCMEPRCGASVGNLLRLDRVLYGYVDKNDTRYAAVLSVVDVQSKQTIESVSMTSQPGVGWQQLLDAALAKLHGQPDEEIAVAYKTYFGPQVHNEKEFYIASATATLAGLAMVMAGGAFTQTAQSTSFEDELSGIATRASSLPLSAKPSALAGSYVAASDDAYGMFYNPAGLSWVRDREVMITYNNHFGVNNFAASYVNKATRELGFGESFLFSGDSLSNEMYITTAAAYTFNQLLDYIPSFSLGASLRFASINSQGSTEDSQSEKSWGAAVDLGARVELSESIMFGILFRDLISAVRVNNTKSDYSYNEFNPVQMQLGGTFAVGNFTKLYAGGVIPVYQDQVWKMSGGLQRKLFKYFMLRLGAEKTILSSVHAPWKVTGGLGVETATKTVFGEFVAVDASYAFNQFSPFSNQLHFSMRFGF